MFSFMLGITGSGPFCDIDIISGCQHQVQTDYCWAGFAMNTISLPLSERVAGQVLGGTGPGWGGWEEELPVGTGGLPPPAID